MFLQQYVQYLQSMGFILVQVRPQSPARRSANLFFTLPLLELYSWVTICVYKFIQLCKWKWQITDLSFFSGLCFDMDESGLPDLRKKKQPNNQLQISHIIQTMHLKKNQYYKLTIVNRCRLWMLFRSQIFMHLLNKWFLFILKKKLWITALEK